MSEEKQTTEEQQDENKGFWAKNIVSILLIVFLIISGIYAFNRDPAENDKDVEEKVSDIKNNDKDAESTESSEETAKTEDTDTKEEMTKEAKTEVKTTEEAIIVSAGKGDGVTHLARKAIAEYSSMNNITLSKEQKLYAETVLKNSYYQHHLTVGQDISFSVDTLSETVQNAQNLTEGQIKAWSKYAAAVPNL